MRLRLTTAGIVGPGVNTTSEEVVTVVMNASDPDPNNSNATAINGEGDGDGGGYLVAAWRYDDGLGGAGARAEHPTVLVDLGDGTTRMLSYETYYDGLFTGAIALLRDRLQERFETQARDLKAYVERSMV
ncbi:hypothetical protein F4809DRAFT_601325 [Biscogniauxia mediterranea]|nr:hypothetical protein F4809DRAFT_601325 [Biscogniauxia mediterranea]